MAKSSNSNLEDKIEVKVTQFAQLLSKLQSMTGISSIRLAGGICVHCGPGRNFE